MNEVESNAFLLTWKESGWPHSNIVRMHDLFQKQGYVDQSWRLRAYRKAKVGDRVWLFKQGSSPKGIFGKGVITTPPELGEAGNGKQQMMAGIRFFEFVDPKTALLLDEEHTRAIISEVRLHAQASGNQLTNDEAVALERLMPDSVRPPITSTMGDDTPFDPNSIADAREKVVRGIAQRRGQKAFRDALIDAYAGRCAITGCSILDVLEAAHIYPYRGPDTNHINNGLLLRGDLHILFDCLLIAIEPDTLKVTVAPSLRGSEYGALDGRTLAATRTSGQAPSKEALKQHHNECVRLPRWTRHE